MSNTRTLAVVLALVCALPGGTFLAGCGDDSTGPSDSGTPAVDPYLLEVWRSGAPSVASDPMHGQSQFAEWYFRDWIRDGDAEAVYWEYDADQTAWAIPAGIASSEGYYQVVERHLRCWHKWTQEVTLQLTKNGTPVKDWSAADEATLTISTRRWVEILTPGYESIDPPLDHRSTATYVASGLMDGFVTVTGLGTSEGHVLKILDGEDVVLGVSSNWELDLDFSSLVCPGGTLTATYRVHGEDEVLDEWSGQIVMEADAESYEGLFASEFSKTSRHFTGQRFCRGS